MVEPNDFSCFPQPSAWQSPNFICMNRSLEPRQPQSLPACINSGSYMFSANMALPGFVLPGFPSLKAEQTNEAHGVLQCLPSRFPTLFPTINPYLKENQSPLTYGLSGRSAPTAMPMSSQKRLLVFDQSGNQTRLVYNSVYPPAQNPNTATTNLVQKEVAVKTEQLTPLKPVSHEESDDNRVSGEERDTHEDTEEINALLYSDEDDYSDDDSVMSTDHSPFAIIGSYDKQEQVEEITEEVASSDGLNKRQKLLDGGYNKSSQTDTVSSVKVEGPHEYDDDAESSYANGQTQRAEVGSLLDKMQSRKDKIRSTLRTLESIIPGAKGKDPLLVIDEAIAYLNSLKLKAKTLGVNNY